MYSDELKRYFRERINKTILEFSTTPLERTEETFHDLRVDIKKIKALYELIHYCTKKFHRHKSFKVYTEVFKAAGEVRDTHIKESIIREYGLAKNGQKILSAIRLKREKAIEKFEKVIGRKLVKQVERNGKGTEKFLAKIKEKDLSRYLNKELAKTEDLVKRQLAPGGLHKTRMKLKELLYNLKLQLPSDDKLIINLDKLQELIGSWHDCVFVVKYFDELIAQDKLSVKEAQQLKAVRKKVGRKKYLLSNKINQSRTGLDRAIKAHRPLII
jgi:CHAD domain-containing protein